MICLILGTRPEIIKMSPIIRLCQKEQIPFQLIHTGQHYSINMDQVFFEELHLPQPHHALDVGTKASKQGHQTGMMVEGIERILLGMRPEVVLVQGDTNSVLAGALAASKIHIKVGHVEAGLRSYDRQMPEEVNRILCDHVSDYLFCPTDGSAKNVRKEGIVEEKIHITGNTIVDAVTANSIISDQESIILHEMALESGSFILLTAHRAENVDNESRFTSILDAIKKIDYPIIYPIHPRAKKMAEEFGLLDQIPETLRIVDPIGYMDFLQLQKNARLMLTDSGGIQEEACILGVPCLTLRENTERPETVSVGANELIGWKTDKILNKVENALQSRKDSGFSNPFGDGKASEKILQIIGVC